MGISTRMGLAIAAGVPVLVLVSMGSVAGLAGPPSVLVWLVSAAIGCVMAVLFAELADSFPETTGGIGVLSARVLEPRSRTLATASQWSYWFGWSPALAINGILIGTYLRSVLMPSAPQWTSVALAIVVLCLSVTANHFGLRKGAALQVVLAVCVSLAVVVLVIGAFAHGQVDFKRLTPFAPPNGWLSAHSMLLLGGGLFIAGWSAYGSELALTYRTEFTGGSRDALATLVVIALISVAVYGAVPLLLVAAVGSDRLQDDPATALTPLASTTVAGAVDVVLVLLVMALLLGLNMVAIGSSRSLYQMARNGHAWSFLGRGNRHGVPGNALRFDLAANIVLLLVIVAVNRGPTADVPIALLVAANVGYFLSVDLALVAVWLNHRAPSAGRAVVLRAGLCRLAVPIAALNGVFLLCAGFAFGWRNLVVGAGLLIVAISVFGGLARRAARHAAPTVRPSIRPVCMAWGAEYSGIAGGLTDVRGGGKAVSGDPHAAARLVGRGTGQQPDT